MLHFWYDAQGRPAIVDYNGIKYTYIHNLQGDIVGIIDSTGAEVVQYTYDAWGKVLSTARTMASSLGTVQPFRYRGYVYDVETELYYLKSRYYNSLSGRFVSADAYIFDDLLDNNAFCYCLNSPVDNIDESGYGINIKLGNFIYRIDSPNATTVEKRHIQIFEDGKEYTQNEDGSPHKGNKGGPSNTVKKKLKKEGIWDWDGNKSKYINRLKELKSNAKTVIRCQNEWGELGVLISDGNSAEFCYDDDFVEAGGWIGIDGKIYLSYPIVIVPIIGPFLIPSCPAINPIPATSLLSF